MLQLRYHIRVFIASPGDVAEERDAVGEVINELNLTSARLLGLWLEPVRWETHAFPAMGPDAQSIINAQIGDDFEIFIGLLGTKLARPLLARVPERLRSLSVLIAGINRTRRRSVFCSTLKMHQSHPCPSIRSRLVRSRVFAKAF
jgi:hypothetical protein